MRAPLVSLLVAALLLVPAVAADAAFSVPRLVPHLPTRQDTALEAKLARLGSSFDGQVGIFVEDLDTGSYAGWNDQARLPAASTVKIGVIAEGIRRFGYGPGSPIDADLRAIGQWSSNLAANRVFTLVGGVGPIEAALHRLGMFSSTYPEPYALSPSEKPKKPKRAKKPARATAGLSIGGHTRVTTARDLARALFRLQAAAAGQPWAIAATELSADQARAALGYLSLADPGASLFSFPAGTSHAEKDGWIDDVRASAALVYGPRYARIVVVLAYRPGVTLADGRALGARVSSLAFP
jgi:Beta-lactamase enzyme family